jgi:recombination protein RecT
MIRQLISKWGVMSTDFEKAYEADMGVIENDGNITYVDNDDSVAETTAVEQPKSEPEFGMNPPVEEVKVAKKKEEIKHTAEDVEAIAASLFK